MEQMSLEDFAKNAKNIAQNTQITLNGEEIFIFSEDEEFILDLIKNEQKCTDE